jgi:hypothetical protein
VAIHGAARSIVQFVQEMRPTLRGLSTLVQIDGLSCGEGHPPASELLDHTLLLRRQERWIENFVQAWLVGELVTLRDQGDRAF